jgi:hypothetical protein
VKPEQKKQEHQTPKVQKGVLGFGQHKDRTWKEVRTLFPDYCQWVIMTMRTEPESSPLLVKYGEWLVEQESEDLKKEVKTPREETKKEPKSVSPTTTRAGKGKPVIPTVKPEQFDIASGVEVEIEDDSDEEKDRVPVWDGNPESFDTFVLKAQRYVLERKSREASRGGTSSDGSWMSINDKRVRQ